MDHEEDLKPSHETQRSPFPVADGDQISDDLSPGTTKSTETASEEERLVRQLISKFMRLHKLEPRAAVAVADTVLEMVAPKFPDFAPFFGSAHSEIEFFAETVCDSFMVALFLAFMKRFESQGVPTLNARKRALQAIWESLTFEQRRIFLDWAQRRMDRGG
jgi:hypothetical protein